MIQVFAAVIVAHIRGTRDIDGNRDEVAIFEPIVVRVMMVLRTLGMIG